MFPVVAKPLQMGEIHTSTTSRNNRKYSRVGVRLVYRGRVLGGRGCVGRGPRSSSRLRLTPPSPADAVGPLVAWDFLELAIYGGDEGTEVFVAEGVGDEDAARVGPARFAQDGQKRKEVGDVGGDEHPALGDGEIQHVLILEPFEVLLGVDSPDIVSAIP